VLVLCTLSSLTPILFPLHLRYFLALYFFLVLCVCFFGWLPTAFCGKKHMFFAPYPECGASALRQTSFGHFPGRNARFLSSRLAPHQLFFFSFLKVAGRLCGSISPRRNENQLGVPPLVVLASAVSCTIPFSLTDHFCCFSYEGIALKLSSLVPPSPTP